ncbi:MAG TPA: DUF2914 domain-containing protein [Methylomirabilota bacterium]|nr:DUF2914 domain-containing protein [Methylomirabilota bacterium]
MSPLLAWLRRWGVSFASLVGGLFTLFVFRRGLPRVSWIVGYLLLLWLLVATLVQVRETLAASDKRAHRLVLTATEYTIQTLYHGVLLFLLPAYWAATTLTSPNAVFFVLLVVLALLATFDPCYRAVVHPRPWAGYIFFLVSMFGALNLALPLVGLPPFAALLIAAWLSVIALTPAVCRARRWRWITGLLVTTLAGLLAAGLAGLRPIVVPPAPLFLARAELGWTLGTLDSLEPIAGAIHAADLRERGLVAYTAIYAPAGLRQAVEHVWRREGRVVNVVRLTPVHGGRREGFRTYSRKTAFPADPVGRWTVDVVTGYGQLIGRLRFRVLP